MLIPGRCHCANIRFSLDWQPEPTDIPARACTCSFCQKHGGVWTSCPTGFLQVAIAEPASVSRYAFGTKTADFLICSRCGVVPVVTCSLDGRLHAVVSVNAFDGVDQAMLRRSPASFEGETEAVRLDRRRRHWISNVEITEEGG